jgi:hypothetical protein
MKLQRRATAGDCATGLVPEGKRGFNIHRCGAQTKRARLRIANLAQIPFINNPRARLPVSNISHPLVH